MKQLLLTFGLLAGFWSHAQYQDLLVPAGAPKKQSKILHLGFQDLSFIKDNEYFNLIADGYTLLGNQLYIDFNYRPQPNYKITMGASLLKYDGLSVFSKVVPYLGLEIDQGNSTFYLGKLYTADNHGLADEIYTFERQLDQRHIENGLQHRFKNKHWQTDTWLQWEHFIFKGDTMRERLNFGQTTTYKTSFNHWTVSFPLQVYLQHRGGQINLKKPYDDPKNNAIVIANGLSGLAVENHLTKQTTIGLKYLYYIFRTNTNRPEELIFTSGTAQKLQIYLKHRHWATFLAFWQANRFVAPKGNDMFQSISRRTERFLDQNNQTVSVFKNHTEPNRKLLCLTTTYHKEIFKNLNLAFVIDVYDQLNHSSLQSPYYQSDIYHQLDYALGLYLLYKFDFKLLSIK